jgi:hypothetical protein
MTRRLHPPAIPVIAAAPEQKYQYDDQEDEVHELFLPFRQIEGHKSCQEPTSDRSWYATCFEKRHE